MTIACNGKQLENTPSKMHSMINYVNSQINESKESNTWYKNCEAGTREILEIA